MRLGEIIGDGPGVPTMSTQFSCGCSFVTEIAGPQCFHIDACPHHAGKVAEDLLRARVAIEKLIHEEVTKGRELREDR